jgi:uncharacterized membrane protein YgcG
MSVLKSVVLGVAILCLGAWGRMARADETPSTEATCLNDHAGVVSAKDAKRIKALCQKAERDHVQMMIVTVRSLADYQPRPLNLDTFVDDIFDEWDIEYDAAKDAIFLFVARKEHQIRIRLGDAYGDKARKKAQHVMRKTVGPTLRRGTSAGLRRGFSRLYKEVALPRIQRLKREEQERKRKQGVVNFE